MKRFPIVASVMTTVLCLISALFAFAERQGDSALSRSRRGECAFEYYSYTHGEMYHTCVTKKQLQAAPIWKKDAEHPPLAARNAIRLAKDHRKKTVATQDDFEWRFESANLVPVDNEGDGHWVWVICFYESPKTGGVGGQLSDMNIVVLMDGTVVEADVSVINKGGRGLF